MVRVRSHIQYPVRVEAAAPKRSLFWAAWQDQIVRDHYLTTEASVLAHRVGKTATAIIVRAARLGIVKCPNVAAGKRKQQERMGTDGNQGNADLA